ncbi:HD-GYP domain-containing protein [Gracilibacillus dipsosauri]|uniref:HD-GYP domain-containing protein n=1 Tax=Gracilibacillus dipsosauri TaxID=178340 RepID=A0A317L2P5_9BACI|nr:HD-GYP domain-containing protein [Gracilibacillus dipsosauri]
MQVHPKQLVPGCIVLEPVIGKSDHPIIESNTVIEEHHIKLLKNFGISTVEVSSKLVTGLDFQPEKIGEKQLEKKREEMAFERLYLKAVKHYKQFFTNWQTGVSINIQELTTLMTPLFELVDKITLDLFLLYEYASKKDYFYHHGISIALISAYLAKKLGYKEEWDKVGLAGLLADCGMAKLNPAFLHREDKLTVEEYDEVKHHPRLSYRLVEHITSLSEDVKLGIIQHHERGDGSGYPLGVKGDEIHLYAKIIAITDTYHAMTSERLYRRKQSPFKVVEEMLKLSQHKLDATILQVFVDSFFYYSIGTRVLLSNGKEALIVSIKRDTPVRPVVQLVEDAKIISLKDKPTLFIEKILK